MIRISDLSKKYGNTKVFDQTNLTLPSKGLFCFLGPSGCGKSTLLNLLAGFDTNFTGNIEVNNTNISKLSSEELTDYRRNNIGFIFQDYILIPGYTSLDNLLLASDAKGKDEGQSIELSKHILEKLNISDKINQDSKTLSGGEKQRVSIARALINNPSIILADEPTGALDRGNSNEIMKLLHELSKTKLVLVITHDPKCAEYADDVITIEDFKIISKTREIETDDLELDLCKAPGIKTLKRSYKNFKLRMSRYLAIALTIAIGVVCFGFSLSTGGIIDQSIDEFKTKNNAYQNGFIKLSDKDNNIQEILKKDSRIEGFYHQYILKDVKITVDDNEIFIPEKFPIAKSLEQMSYGRMPAKNNKTIAISPSLASKLASNIEDLVGKELTLNYHNKIYRLTISGIFNGTFDDFIISSDIEEKLYVGIEEKPYSISYDVKEFEDIPRVSQDLKNQDIQIQDASKEVESFLKTFENIERLFHIIATVILIVAIFMSAVLIIKQQRTRYQEVGLLSALGYTQKQTKRIIFTEGTFLSILSAVITSVMIIIITMVSYILNFDFYLGSGQVIIMVLIGTLIISIIMYLSNKRLVSIEPSEALRK